MLTAPSWSASASRSAASTMSGTCWDGGKGCYIPLCLLLCLPWALPWA
jgi:hypothetical protein